MVYIIDFTRGRIYEYDDVHQIEFDVFLDECQYLDYDKDSDGYYTYRTEYYFADDDDDDEPRRIINRYSNEEEAKLGAFLANVDECANDNIELITTPQDLKVLLKYSSIRFPIVKVSKGYAFEDSLPRF